MVYKIIWSITSIKTYISKIEYLEAEWTDKEAKNFINAVKRKLQLLSSHPELGNITNKRRNVRKSVIHKRVILFYRVKKFKKEIELIRFWPTKQNPHKLKL
ncbi:MAG: type II toxin-antitoxin system RelE/ParE family toxin [Chitinophagaceae bacterium]